MKSALNRLVVFFQLQLDGDFACGIRTDHTIVCWGKNGSDGLNPPSGAFISLSAGYNHVCAIRNEDNALVCWGSNSYGQAPNLSISPVSLGTLDIGGHYSISLQASGGRTNSYSYQAEGELPPGLSLDSNTGQLEGTLTQAGYFDFTIKVTELGLQPALKASFAYQVTVRAQVSVSIEGQAPGAEMAGKPVRLKVVVTEKDGDYMGASPQGQITLTLSDGQSCSQDLDSTGQAWCTFFIQNRTGAEITIYATANYAGNGLFLPGDNLASPLENCSDAFSTSRKHPYRSQSHLCAQI